MNDALTSAKFGGGLFLTEFPAKIRVLTTDPVVSIDQFGNTRYGFVVWNLEEDKPQILNKGPSFAKRFQEIHLDSDFGNDIRKIDIKITATGTGKETRYTISPLGSPYDLKPSQIKEAANINLEEALKNGIRLSKVNQGEELPVTQTDSGYEQAKATAKKIQGEDTVIEDIGDEPIDLSDIPF